MYTFSNILSIYQMVSDRLVLSNLLYDSELDHMGGVIFSSQNTTAHIAPI
jgi:hypothetical protein